jgi:hypothetical protein
MTRTTNARIAGAAFLLYIAVGITQMAVKGSVSTGVNTLLTLFCCFMALALAVTLYSITRAVDQDIAMLGFSFRIAEGVVGASGAVHEGPLVPATFFAFGSLFFCWLLLRGRLIPASLAWLGVVASVLLVVALPLQLAGVMGGKVAGFMWGPMALFEVVAALWLMVKGVPRMEVMEG